MRLDKHSFKILAATVDDIATAIEDFDEAKSEYEEAEDADDREQARDSAMTALGEIIAYADNNLRPLVQQIEE